SGMRFKIQGTETDILCFKQLSLNGKHDFLLFKTKNGHKILSRGRFERLKKNDHGLDAPWSQRLIEKPNDGQAHYGYRLQRGWRLRG
ncbi:MAG: hypothetical protein HYU84_12885, partial [Chloroflexi bacterium]|nr:hypothetical protein [Chloroflexota bacterium]